MKDYRITLKLLSATGTPWRSDTLAGHLVWMKAWKDGSEGAAELLEEFKSSEPPFILSDGFPRGFMPAPVGGNGFGKEVENLAEYGKEKERKKARYIDMENFRKFRLGEHWEVKIENFWRETEIAHAAIDRMTGLTSTEGGEFFRTVDRYLGKGSELDVYARVKEGKEVELEELFRELSRIGYGRDVTVGLGNFDVAEFEPVDEFHPVGDEDAFISLSTFCPAGEDPVEGRYRVEVKYGKLGMGIHENPFKKPLVQLLPGAVFRTDKTPRPFYGRVVENIAPGMPDAAQLCHCLTVPCKWS